MHKFISSAGAFIHGHFIKYFKGFLRIYFTYTLDDKLYSRRGRYVTFLDTVTSYAHITI